MGWAAGAAESTGPTCGPSKSPCLLQPALEAGGVRLRPSGTCVALGTGRRQAGVVMVIAVASSSEPQPSSPERGGPSWGVGAKSGASSPTRTGQGHRPLWASRRAPGWPHLVRGGGHVPFESLENDLPLAPPTSRARYPHEKSSSGRASAFVIRCH